MSEEIYSHWSREPLVIQAEYRSPYMASSVARGFKPDGLWFDVNGEWPKVSPDPPEYFRYRNVLDIDLAALLRLSTPLGMDVFTETYAVEDFISEVFPDHRSSIDWSRLIGVYKGILIAPYCWQRRRKPRTSWYYPWDCASGCIWDLSAIRSITTTEEVAVEQ